LVLASYMSRDCTICVWYQHSFCVLRSRHELHPWLNQLQNLRCASAIFFQCDKVDDMLLILVRTHRKNNGRLCRDSITNHLGKCSSSSSELPESGQLLFVLCQHFVWVVQSTGGRQDRYVMLQKAAVEKRRSSSIRSSQVDVDSVDMTR